MNEIQIYNNEDFGEIRVVNIDGEPWFVAVDVCRALEISNSRDALSRLDDDEKGVVSTDTLGGIQNVSAVNEPGLYSLVLGSRKPEAKAFKRWITHDVIPAIRKTGSYSLNTPKTYAAALRELADKVEENEQLRLANAVQEQKINELQPKADYTDEILKSAGAMTVTQIAKDYGMGPKETNKLLNKLGIQYKQSGQWLLYAKYQSFGYTKSETVPIVRANGMNDFSVNTKWTQKGRLFLYDILKQNGVLPIIEQAA